MFRTSDNEVSKQVASGVPETLRYVHVGAVDNKSIRVKQATGH